MSQTFAVSHPLSHLSRLFLPRLFLFCCCLCLCASAAQAASQHAKAASQHTNAAPVQATAKVTASQVAQARPDVHVNHASAAELSEALVGVGPAKAKAIVAYRQTHGTFKSLDDLSKVKGVGPSILKKNKTHILFN